MRSILTRNAALSFTVLSLTVVGCKSSNRLSTPAAVTTDTLSTSESELVAAAAAYDKISAQQDAAAAEQLLAEEYILTDLLGRVTTKAQWLVTARSIKNSPSNSKSETREARVYGDVGVVTGRWHESGTQAGQAFDYRLRYSTVFIKRDGRWQVLLDHATRIQ